MGTLTERLVREKGANEERRQQETGATDSNPLPGVTGRFESYSG
jgi:hypothetical protein